MPPLHTLFPGLGPGTYQVKSPATPAYNCIAWAASRNDAWWWPDPMDIYFWPRGALRQEALDAFVQVFSSFGYILCDTADLQPGFEKIAIYAKSNGLPTHAARQLQTGVWTSKLGSSEDIEHLTPADLSGNNYGAVVLYMKRRS